MVNWPEGTSVQTNTPWAFVVAVCGPPVLALSVNEKPSPAVVQDAFSAPSVSPRC